MKLRSPNKAAGIYCTSTRALGRSSSPRPWSHALARHRIGRRNCGKALPACPGGLATGLTCYCCGVEPSDRLISLTSPLLTALCRWIMLDPFVADRS